MKILKYSLLAALLVATACGGTNKKFNAVKNEQDADLINKQAAQKIQEVEVSDRVYFDFDKFNLNKESQKTLDLQAEFLQQDSNIKATITGHCDERGTREYNLALGERRANTVKKYLVKKGVKSNRLNTISYGKEKPEFVGKGEEVWSKNRRAVLVINN